MVSQTVKAKRKIWVVSWMALITLIVFLLTGTVGAYGKSSDYYDLLLNKETQVDGGGSEGSLVTSCFDRFLKRGKQIIIYIDKTEKVLYIVRGPP